LTERGGKISVVRGGSNGRVKTGWTKMMLSKKVEVLGKATLLTLGRKKMDEEKKNAKFGKTRKEKDSLRKERN